MVYRRPIGNVEGICPYAEKLEEFGGSERCRVTRLLRECPAAGDGFGGEGDRLSLVAAGGDGNSAVMRFVAVTLNREAVLSC